MPIGISPSSARKQRKRAAGPKPSRSQSLSPARSTASLPSAAVSARFMRKSTGTSAGQAGRTRREGGGVVGTGLLAEHGNTAAHRAPPHPPAARVPPSPPLGGGEGWGEVG